MLSKKKKLWAGYYSQQGEEATAPSPLIANSLDTESANLLWYDTGADNYVVQRATQSDFSDATQVYSGATASFDDSGLTVGTTYYHRVKAQVTGKSDSDWVTASITTIGPMPLAVWDFTGLAVNLNLGASNGLGVTNSYGTTGTNGSVQGVNSVINTSGIGLTKTASYPVLSRNSAHYPYTVLRTNNNYLNLASDLTMSGDFTICFRINSLVVTSVHYLFSNTGGSTTNQLYMQQNRVNIRFGTTTDYSISWPSLLSDTRTLYKIVIRKEGTNVKVSNDGGTTWSSNTVVGSGLTLTVNRIFANSTGGNVFDNYVDRVWIDDSALTQAQINQRFNYVSSAAETIAEDEAIVPGDSLTYAALVNGYVDDVITASTIGSPQKHALITNGQYSYSLSNGPQGSPNYGYQVLHIYDHVNDKAAKFNIGYLLPDDDIHNFGTIARIGNKIVSINPTKHYDDGNYSSLIWRTFGDNFKFNSLEDYPQHRGVSSINWCQTQYHQLERIGNTFYLFMQEYGFTGSSAYRSLLGKSIDGCKSWAKIPAVDLGAGTKFIYDETIYNNGEIFILSYIADASIGGRNLTAHFRRTSDGITYSNLSGGYSKNVLTDGPLTEAELNTNFQLKDGTATTQGTQIGQGFVAADGLIYFTIYDGTTDKWQFAYGRVGDAAFTFVDIPWDGKSIVTAIFSGSAGAYTSVINRAIPIAVRISGNTFDYYAFETNGGFWRLVKFRTTDVFATGSYVEAITNDDAKQHNLAYISPNYEFSNTATIQATGATGINAGKLFMKVIK